jgi:glycosyltransferase involved in cell wall biosynthesis
MNKKLPIITVVTVVYNGVAYLEETIKSVISQDYPNIEYIIIDGGSNDGTIEIIKKYNANISRWVSEADKGIYDAMNKGLRLAVGEWVNFLNGGDRFYDKNTISELFTRSDHQMRDLLYGDSIIHSSTSERLIKARPLSKESLRFGMEVCHQSIFVRRSVSPNYNLLYRYKAEYNWVVDIFNLISAERAEYVNIPIVYYALGGFSEKGLLQNLAEFIKITMTRYGILQTVRNSPHYLVIFLRYLKYKLSGYER